MCGLVGVFTTDGGSADDLRCLTQRMMSSLVHRGPDDHGSWFSQGGVAFGFRRLAIQDLSEAGHQPMASASGRFVMVFNGEVYNHPELRRDLEGCGHRFRGHSDTEVILAGFEQWGMVEAVRRFVGMFAMAVWDSRHQSLTLIRDRLGIKPLHVYWRPGRLMFASELKAFMADPGFDRTLDEEAISAYLQLLYVPAPQCVFRHVTKLLPGHMMTVTSPRKPLPPPEPYWSVEELARSGGADPIDGSDEEFTDLLEGALTESIRVRLRADVPVGALLSGGVDSSVVVALAQAASSRPVKTYAIGFDAAEHDESAAASAVARHLGTEHTELMLPAEDSLDVVARLPELFDEPLADPSAIPIYLICALASKEVTVGLSGDGGDEVFGGYHRYIEGARLIQHVRAVPTSLRRPLGAAIGSVSSSSWDRGYRVFESVLPQSLRHRLPGEKAAKLGAMMSRVSEADMYLSLLSAWRGPNIPKRVSRIGSARVAEILSDPDSLPLRERMMLADQVTYLPDDLLAKVDRASMASSLEVRVPLLDHRVLELAWRLPARSRIRGSEGKWILRNVLRRHVPDSLVDRPKMGFTVPIAAWMSGPLRELIRDTVGDREQDLGFEPGELTAAWRAFEAGHTGLANALWAVFVLAAWQRRWRT
ncbi:MAG: asparagine synthase (glutamine-hydrolyzing) [Dehalococcoidia bacterium]